MSIVEIDRSDLEALIAIARRTLGSGHPVVQRGGKALHPSAAVVLDLAPVLAEADDVDAAFEAWWKVYPRKAKKGYARRCFRTASKKVSCDELIAGAQRFAGWVAEAGTPTDYIQHPSTWLNGEAWLDGPEAVPRSRPDRQAESRSAMIDQANRGTSFADRMAAAAASQRAIES